MANQQNSYTGSQGTGTNNADFSFTFPSFTTSEVKVEVDNVVKTLTAHYTVEEYNTTSGGKVRFTSGNIPTGTTPLRIFRQTDVDSAKATFSAGASLKAGELNDNFKQVRHALQEAIGATYDGNNNLTSRQVQSFNIEDSSITSAKIKDNTIINADVNEEAAIDGTKVTPAFGSQNVSTTGTAATGALTVTGNIAVSGTVDGRDVATDGTKLDGIETAATADQTAAEIRTLVESASDSNVFTDADHSKLNAIEASATADQTASEIRTLVESASDSNVFTDADHSKLNAIEAGATADQTDAEIRAAVESATDSNVFTDADHSKLNGIESGATADQTASEIKSLIASSPLDASHLAENSVDTSEIASGAIDSTKLNANTVVTNSEQASASVNDTSFFTTSASDARYFNISSGDTIKDGQSFPDNDTTIATTAAINDRIIDLVDDVGGFVPIANETSFPNSNPDVNNGAGTLISIQALSQNLTSNGAGEIAINNGTIGNSTVFLVGAPANTTFASGFGLIVETKDNTGGTANTYTFHRLVPKATEVTTVAGKATEIGRLGTADAVADMAILGTTDVVADMAILGTTDVVADMNMLATSDIVADMNMLAVSDVISDMNDLATSGNITAMSTCSTNIASINNCSTNISSANNYGDQYQVAANNPSTDGGGNALAAGDLYFNTSANELKVYNGSSWQGGVTATGSFAVVTGNTFTGDNRYNDGVKALFGTGSDLEIFHDGTYSRINSENHMFVIGTDLLHINNGANNESQLRATANGAVSLYYDGNKKFETISTGASVTGNLGLGTTSPDFSGFGSNTGGLEINDVGSSNQALLLSTGSNNFYIANNASTNFITGINDAPIKISTNGSERLRIESDGNIKIPADNKKLQIGASQDLEIYHNGSDSFVRDQGTGGLYLTGSAVGIRNSAANEDALTFAENAAINLYYDNSTKLETTSEGIKVTTDIQIEGGSGDTELKLKRTNTAGSNGNAFGSIKFLDENNNDISRISTIRSTAADDGDIRFETRPTGGSLTERLRIKSDGNIQIPDNNYIYVGDGNDLRVRHDATGGNHSYIFHHGTGAFKIASDTQLILGLTSAETFIECNANDNVELYYDNSKKLETTSSGITVNGAAIVGGNIEINQDAYFKLGAGQDLQFHHDGSSSYITNSTGFLFVQSNDLALRSQGQENFITAAANGSVELYYDNVKKFETTSSGVNIPDNAKLGLGSHPSAGGDLLIWHNGSDNFIDTRWNLTIRKDDGAETLAKFNNNASVDLYYDDSKKLETTSTGIQVANTAADVNIRSSTASNSGGGQITFENVDGNGQPRDVVRIKGDTSGNGGYGELTLQTAFNNTLNDRLVLKQDGNVQIPTDSAKLQIGASQDLSLYHDGSNSYFENTTGHIVIKDTTDKIYLQSPEIVFEDDTTNEVIAKFISDGAVDLYYDNHRKLSTTSTGIEIPGNCAIELDNGDWTGNHAGKIQHHNDALYLQGGSGTYGHVFIDHGGDDRWAILDTGHFIPWTNNTYDIGTSAKRVRNIYTNDLHLSNEGSSNDVDGTWGDWTIQEGKSDLFLKNNRSGKKYKFNLTEVS